MQEQPVTRSGRAWLPCVWAWLGGLLLAFFAVTGMIYAPSRYLNGLLLRYVRYLPVFALLTVVIALLLQLLIRWHGPRLEQEKVHNDLGRISFVLLLCVWLVYIGAFYPGSVQTDAMTQLNQGLGFSALTDHHPVAVTWYYTALLRLGQAVADDRFGVMRYGRPGSAPGSSGTSEPWAMAERPRSG